MKLFSKHRVLLAGVFWILVGTCDVSAFSIDALQVKSKFGEKFDASFDIHLDTEGPAKVVLGDADDYRKLGVDRQDITNALLINPAVASGGLKKTVQIYSDNPLFFPSFNFVVRATHNGGTLLENFLVIVDFRQGLSLNLGQGKTKTPKPQHNTIEQEPLLSEITVLRPVELKPVVEELTGILEGAGSHVRNPVPPSPDIELKTDFKVHPRTPVPYNYRALNRRRLSGAIWAYPRVVEATPFQKDFVRAESIPVSGSQPKAPSSEQKTDSHNRPDRILLSENYALKKGEGIFLISRKLNIKNYSLSQVAVAIWMGNIDKFIFGNINGIREGVSVDLQKLEYHLAKIDLGAARNILRSQQVEWDLAINATRVPPQVVDKTLVEIPLPVENLEGIADLFEQVKAWQSTWVKMDVERHLGFYQPLENANSSRLKKERFFSLYPTPHLITSSKILALKEGEPLIFFEQDFSSNNVPVKGLKELEWRRPQSAWKVYKETLYEPPSRSMPHPLKGLEEQNDGKKMIALSYVVHVASHDDQVTAINFVNRLREGGFDAYWVPVKISKETGFYRVYLGRFANWEQAERMVEILKKRKFGLYATAIPYPFALQVGEVATLTEARALLVSLRKSGFSGLLLVSYDESAGVHYRVLVGAYKKAVNTTWMLRKLEQSGYAGKLVSP